MGRPVLPPHKGWLEELHDPTLKVLKTKKLKRKEKSWQEEPGGMEEQRWGRSENLDDPELFSKVIVSG